MLQNYMSVFYVSEEHLKTLHDSFTRQQSETALHEFEVFLKKLMVHLRKLKAQVKQLIETTNNKIDLEK